MSPKDANLHVSRITVRQAAELMNVSVRTVYDARKLWKSGRVDLVAQVDSGKLSIHRALILAGLKQSPVKASLRNAWASASENERKAFLYWIEGARNDQGQRQDAGQFQSPGSRQDARPDPSAGRGLGGGES